VSVPASDYPARSATASVRMRTTRALVVLVVILVAAIGVYLVRSGPEALAPLAPELPSVAETAEVPIVAPVAPDRTAAVARTEEPARVPDATPVARDGLLPAPGWEQSPPVVATAARTLEVQTLRLDAALADVPVAIWPLDSGEGPEDPDAVVPPTQIARTGADGLVVFRDLAPAGYGVRAWFGAGDAVSAEALVAEADGSGRRVFLRSGSGTVHGHVFSGAGEPAGGARVTLIESVQKAHSIRRSTAADALGAFRFDAVPAGFVILLCDDVRPGARDRARFLLDEGETHRVDLGAYAPTCAWSGRVVTEDGDALAVAFHLVVDEVQRGNTHQARCAADGSFALVLPIGEYAVRVDAWKLPGVRLERDVETRDLVLPGGAVHGKLGTPLVAAKDRRPWPPTVGATRRGSADAQAVFAQIDADGYRLLGLERGVYGLRALPPWTIAGATGGELELDLRGGRALVVLDLELERR